MTNAIKEPTTEEQILAAAKRVFLRKGYTGSRMQEVADEADINKAMLHYYFRSKERLFDVILAQAVGTLVPILGEVLGRTELSVTEKLELMVDKHIGVIEREPHLPMFVLHELSQRPEEFVGQISLSMDLERVQYFLLQIAQEVADGKIRSFHPAHLLMSTMGVIVFPYVAGPLIRTVTGMSKEIYRTALSERKEQAKQFIRAALRP